MQIIPRSSSLPTDSLTSTSYAVLGLLALQPGSAYDLVREARRSLRHFWPRAERLLYEEPKRLEALRLVRGHEERTGRRVRTVYEITEAGRRALAEWFERPSAGPQFESEAVLKASLGDLTTKDRLLSAIAELRAQAEEGLAEGRAIARAVLDGQGPSPERIHVVALMYEFVFSHFETMGRWATWAERQVQHWPNPSTPDDPSRALEVFRRALRRPSGRPARARPAGPQRGRA
ncbi:MAG: PadR family transcriptional regulator [Candidatus Rokubacteria bacterium]|nr:PadR family transcriptional regulator [Candidatus Rokubacteria bacterium]